MLHCVSLRSGHAAYSVLHAKHITINWQSVHVSVLGLNAIFVQCVERKFAVIVVKLDVPIGVKPTSILAIGETFIEFGGENVRAGRCAI